MKSYPKASLPFLESREKRDYLRKELPSACDKLNKEETMDNEELQAMIPSETVRQYILDTKWTFTDMQKAALLYHSPLPLEQRYSRLRALRDKTGDERLRKQITEYLNLKEQGFQAFRENGDMHHIYVLKIKDEENAQYCQIQPHGYFFRWDMAYTCGKQGTYPFQIEKCVVCDGDAANDDEAPSVASLSCNEDGLASGFWSREVPFNEEDDGYFTYVFYEVPNPFERGDIIKLAGTEDYGIVETSQQSWKKALERYQGKKKFPPDYSDVQIRIAFLNDDGTFSHAHINPIYLERCLPYECRKNDTPMNNLLLCASDLYKGEGSLDGLFFSTMLYRNSMEK